MHTDERVDLKNDFLLFFNETYWNNYNKKKKQISMMINGFFRILHLLILIAVLGLGFASVREYIPKQWWLLSLFLALLWILIEYINLERLDNYFLRKTYLNLFKKMKEDEKLINYLTVFEQNDFIPNYFSTKLLNSLNIKTSSKGIEKIKQLLYYLSTVKGLEEDTNPVIEENNPHVLSRDEMMG